jgi:integrase
MKPWDKQIYAKKEKIPTVNGILDLAKSISNDRDRCLFVLTYLTAGRMQELVRYSGKDENRDSVKGGDIEIKEKNGRKVLLINLRNEKHLTRHRKDLPVPLDIKENQLFFELISGYLESIEDNEEVFKIGYKRAYVIITQINPYWNPHFIRHIRLTHLVTVYGYREHQLMLYAGWSDPRPAKHYLELRWEDLMY